MYAVNSLTTTIIEAAQKEVLTVRQCPAWLVTCSTMRAFAQSEVNDTNTYRHVMQLTISTCPKPFTQ